MVSTQRLIPQIALYLKGSESLRTLVLDTSALVMGFEPAAVSETMYTSSTVLQELSQKGLILARFQTALEAGKLIVSTPSKSSVERVHEACNKLGEKGVLSPADVDVIATALDLKHENKVPIILSEDYAVQNVADYLDLESASIANLGIKYRFRWVLYCPACRKIYDRASLDGSCSVCGTPLKRRVAEKQARKT